MSRRNKNAQPEKNKTLERPSSRNDDGKVKVLDILTTEKDTLMIALVLKDMVNIFHTSVFLYVNGVMSVYLRLPANFLDTMRKTLQSIHHLSHSVEEVYKYYKTFLMFRNMAGEMVILPRNSNANIVFKTLENYRTQQHPLSIACVKLQDAYELLENSQCSRCLQTYYDRDICVNCSETKTDEKDMLHDDCTDRGDIADMKHISIKQVKDSLHSSLEKVTLPTLTLERLNPLFGEKEHPPTQVTEEQGQANHYEYAISIDHPSLLPRNNYGFTTTEHRHTETSYPPHTSVSQNTAHQMSTSKPSRYPDYVDFARRMMSYNRWIHARPDPTRLSKAGFFFTNQGDLVRCFQCGIGLKDFSEEDDPLVEHVRHSGDCLFLFEILGPTQLSVIKSKLQQEDPEYNRHLQLKQRNRLTQPAYTSTYRHPEYQNKEYRIASFKNWPMQLTQTPEQLADAGLYYTGFEDHVRCFACDGGLKRWDPDDDPWTEHCRWFPACPFAREQKGEHYIALVQAAVAFENENTEGAAAGGELSGAMEHLTLTDPEYRQALKENKEACMDMGFEESDFNEAVQELRNRGTIKPTIEELVDTIAVVIDRRKQKKEDEARQNETPLEENVRLKRLLFCMTCGKNNVNALFMPCTHHRMCMECADSLTQCPICDRKIRQKIKTYLV